MRFFSLWITIPVFPSVLNRYLLCTKGTFPFCKVGVPYPYLLEQDFIDYLHYRFIIYNVTVLPQFDMILSSKLLEYIENCYTFGHFHFFIRSSNFFLLYLAYDFFVTLSVFCKTVNSCLFSQNLGWEMKWKNGFWLQHSLFESLWNIQL